VTAITSIGYDHIAILGDTLAKIAWQKGGICKVSPHLLSYRTRHKQTIIDHISSYLIPGMAWELGSYAN